MRRRDFLKALFLGPVINGVVVKMTTVQPNILLIICDDLNTMALSWPGLSLPNFDRLRQRGTTYSSTFCQAPICGPSRASFLTGLHPNTTGIYDHSITFRAALPGVVTMPQYFRQNGYYTACNGKIFHPTAGDPDWWDPASWDRADFISPNLKPVPAVVPTNGYTDQWDWGPVNGVYGDDTVANNSIAFLQESHPSPFFLAAGLVAAHVPWYVPWPQYNATPLASVVLPQTMAGDMADIPAKGLHLSTATGMSHSQVVAGGKWAGAVRCYLAALRHLDANLGRILDALDGSAYADNTIVVLCSDHGMHLGEKGHWSKFTLWREACQVPLIMSCPDQECREISGPVALMDIYPTLLELAGLPDPGGLDGVSLAGNCGSGRPVTTTWAGHTATTTRDYREIVYSDGSRERYNRFADPSEWWNLG